MASPIDTEPLPPSGESSKLPALGSPELSADFLAKIKEILEIMLGRRGNSKWDRVVTFRDLYGGGINVQGGAFSVGADYLDGSGNGSNGVITAESALKIQASRFESALRSSPGYKNLMARIGGIDDLAVFPDEIRAQLQHNLADLARSLGAEIRRVEQKIQTGDISMASRLDTITASLNRNDAGIRQVDATYADRTRALATRVTTVTARIDNVDGEGTGVTIEEKFLAQANINSGLLGQWSIKIQAGTAAAPVIAGIDLSVEAPEAGPATSALIFLADKFGFYTTGGNVMPFGIDGSNIYLNGNVLINAGGQNLTTLATNAATPTLNFIGNYASAPAVAGLKENSVYKNTSNGNSYVLKSGAWTSFLDKGTPGDPGATGTRGSRTLYASGSSWSDATANNAITAATGSSLRIMGDTVTISNGSNFAATKYWSGSAWVDPGVVINGNLLVNGTISGNAIYGGTISGVQINIGSGAFSVSSTGVVSADNLFCGLMVADNAGFTAYPALTAYAQSGSADVAATANSNSSNGNSHGLRGRNFPFGTSGIVGTANGYDFYADGSGTNYGPFTGAHDALVPNGASLNLGDIVVDVDCVARRGMSNTLFVIEPSTQANQRGVIGVLANIVGPLANHEPAAMIEGTWQIQGDYGPECMTFHAGAYHDMKDTHTLVSMNAVGEGQINVCGEGGDIVRGDLIVASSMPGKGMRQSDDIVRSYTVAKARESVTFSSSSEVKTIACIYLCG